MPTLLDTRRYLTDFDSKRIGHVVTDVLVVGGGVAGARAALEAARFGKVTLLCKQEFQESATRYAQGGIAVALGADDSPTAHVEDTIRVGCGLNDRDAVLRLVNDSRPRIEEILEWGLSVDRVGEKIALGREGGHSVNRILHAQGDQTGRELARTLERRVRGNADIRVFEHCFLIDFLTSANQCTGVATFHPKYGHQLIWAKRTILASGGCGQVWRETTNPGLCTGDGPAAAFRVGAELADMEMMQFHPTTLYIAGAGRALISEAVRGEGALLVDRAGNRFMASHHPDAELAPRDVVSRTIHHHLRETRSNCVFLDARPIKQFARRFPHIARLCADFQIDVSKELIPVRPSAHYMIGGVATDLDGRTTIQGLFACGEAACTGVHGANRMASNSLLEGLVFGAIAGEIAGREAAEDHRKAPSQEINHQTPKSERTELDLPDIRNSLRSLMWRNVGIMRSGEHLRETCDILDFWTHYTLDKTFDEVMGWEVQNMLTVARLVSLAAMSRTESLGVHFREDSTAQTAPPPYRLFLTRADQDTIPIRRPA